MTLLLRDLAIRSSHACELYTICCVLFVLNELSKLCKFWTPKNWIRLCQTSLGLTLTLALPLPGILQSCFIRKVYQLGTTSEA